MNYAVIKPRDIANGPGIRVSLFVSGCRHHCKGCFNPETWSFEYGTPYTEETTQEILRDLDMTYIEGLSLLGGEPFEPENQETVLGLVKKVRQVYSNMSIWAYSGYLYDDELVAGKIGDGKTVREMLDYIDILVDGEFHEAEKNPSLRFRGSGNQRIIDVRKSLETDSIVLWDEQEDF